ETVLDDTGKTLLREIKGADPAGITCLGPIRSRSWKLKPPGFSGKVTAELWDLADVSLLEISDKVPRAAAAALAAQLIGLLTGTDIRQLDSSKTVNFQQRYEKRRGSLSKPFFAKVLCVGGTPD